MPRCITFVLLACEWVWPAYGFALIHSGSINTAISHVSGGVSRSSAQPTMKSVTFSAFACVKSEPFPADNASLQKWFTDPDAVRILMSTAEQSRLVERRPDGTQLWEISTPIQFP